jgi:hypothetical protein
MKEGIVEGQAFAVDASIIVADAHRRRGVAKIGPSLRHAWSPMAAIKCRAPSAVKRNKTK